MSKYYEYNEKNTCPDCKGHLSLIGTVNNHKYFECDECTTGIKVSIINEMVDDHFEFSGYKEEKTYNEHMKLN